MARSVSDEVLNVDRIVVSCWTVPNSLMDHENPLSNPLVAKAYREFTSKRHVEYKAQRRLAIAQLMLALDKLNQGDVAAAKAVIAGQLHTSQRQDYEDTIASAETILKVMKDDNGPELAWYTDELAATKKKLAALMQHENSGGATAA